MEQLLNLLVGAVVVHDFICIIEKFIIKCRFCQAFWLSIPVAIVIYYGYTYVLWPFFIHGLVNFIDKIWLNNIQNHYVILKKEEQ